MKYNYIFIMILLPSCVYQKIPYTLQTGEIVTCSFAQAQECGVFFDECDDGRIHYCQQNVSQAKGIDDIKTLLLPFEAPEEQTALVRNK